MESEIETQIRDLNKRLEHLKSNLEHQLKLAKEIQKLSSLVEFSSYKGF